MTWAGLPAVLTIAATGWFTLAWLSPAPTTWPQRTLRLCMMVVIGVALHSIWQLLWITLTDGRIAHAGHVLFDVSLPVLMYVILGARKRQSLISRSETAMRGMRASLLLAASLVACGIGVAVTARLALLQPQGAWDAWAIWNFKARWLALGGEAWSEILTNNIFASAHPDYPLLIPLSISRVWMFMSDTPVAVPQAFAVGSAAVMVGLLATASWSFRGPMQAAVAGAAMLAIPSFFVASASQLADVPLACCYLATLIALAAGTCAGADRRWFAVAGLFAGAGMWTKNEGQLFALCAFVSLIVTAAFDRARPRAVGTRVAHFAAGTLPFLAATILIKSFAAGNDFITGQTITAIWEHLLTPARHQEIVQYGIALMRSVADPLTVILLIAYFILRGRAADLRPGFVIGLTILLTTCGYYAVYVITPYPLSWHLTTSANRLLVQLWPSVIFSAILLSGDDGDSPASQLDEAARHA